MDALIDFSRSIVVGLDADGRGDTALTAALDLARRFDSKLVLLHAAPIAPMVWAGAEAAPFVPFLGEEILAGIRERISARIAGRLTAARVKDVDVRVVQGHPASVLLEESRASGASLVALGPHKKRGLFDIGSTARTVLAHSSGGVWVQFDEPRRIRRVLAAIDLSPDSLRALHAARDVARNYGAIIEVLHVFQPPDLGLVAAEEATLPNGWDVDLLRKSARAEFERVTSSFDFGGVAHEERFTDGHPADAILARGGACELSVLGTHGRGGVAAMLVGSVAYAVLRAARGAVLAVARPKA